MSSTEFQPWRELGQLLRDHRQAAGLSVVQAAVKAGFSESVWRQLEKGQRRVGRDVLPPNARSETIVRAAHAVGLDVNDALNAVSRPPITAPADPQPFESEVDDMVAAQLKVLDRRMAGIEAQVAGLVRHVESLLPETFLLDLGQKPERSPGPSGR